MANDDDDSDYTIHDSLDEALEAVRALCAVEMLDGQTRGTLHEGLIALSAEVGAMRSKPTPLHVSEAEWQRTIMTLCELTVSLAGLCDSFRTQAVRLS